MSPADTTLNFTRWFSFLGITIIVGIAGIMFWRYAGIMHMDASNARLRELAANVRKDPADKKSLDELMTAAVSQDMFVRASAIACIGFAGPNADAAVDILTKNLQTDVETGHIAATSLGMIGPKAKSAVPVLMDMVIRHPDDSIGYNSAFALGEIADANDPAVLETLTKISKDSSGFMRDCAVEALQKLSERQAK